MHKPTRRGLARGQDMPTVCQLRPNGNMLRERGRRRRGTEAIVLRSFAVSSTTRISTTVRRIRAIVTSIASAMTASHSLHQQEASRRTSSASSTCLGMSGSGLQIAGTTTIKVRHPTAVLGKAGIVIGGSCGGVPTAMFQALCYRQCATDTDCRGGTTARGSASLERSRLRAALAGELMSWELGGPRSTNL